MSFFGPRKCPNCGLPVPSDAVVCHYCRVTAPRSKISDCGSWIIGAALVFLLVSAFGSDNLFGSRVAETLQGFIPGRGN
jgi:hypothetical protein